MTIESKVAPHRTPEKFGNGVCTLKTPQKIKNPKIAGHFGFVFQETRHRFRKDPFSNCFPSTLKRKVGVSNSSCLKNVFEKLRFRDGLVFTVGQTVEIKLRFQISPP